MKVLITVYIAAVLTVAGWLLTDPCNGLVRWRDTCNAVQCISTVSYAINGKAPSAVHWFCIAASGEVRLWYTIAWEGNY